LIDEYNRLLLYAYTLNSLACCALTNIEHCGVEGVARLDATWV